MGKELPYFKFTVSEWLLGRIADENYRTKGLFIDACCHYWHKECDITSKELTKKLGKTNVKLLQDLDYIRNENEKIIIDFLDIEFSQLSEIQRKRSEGGRKGGLKSAQGRLEGELKDTPSIKIIEDKEKIVYKEYLDLVNNITGKVFKTVNDKTKGQINARLESGYTFEDFRKAITNCFNDAYHKENPKYLTLEFISRPDKFETYLNSEPKNDLPRLFPQNNL